MAFGKRLNGSIKAFIERQPVYFVATAAEDGRVNVSHKGADTLRILDDTHLRWLILSGSGNETAGHLRALNRITLMFCAFEGDAMILRLYGSARVLHPRDSGWSDALAMFTAMAGSRQIIDVGIESLQTSCGTGVPVMRFETQRAPDELVPYYDETGPDGVDAYWRKKNLTTVDGFDTGLIDD